MVEFQGKFDESKTKNLNNRSFRKMWWVFVLVSVLFICIGVAGMLLGEDEADRGLGVFLIVFGVLFTPLVFLLTHILQKNLNKSMSVLSSDTTETYQFFPDRLVITLRKKRYGEEECEYESVTNARYTYLFKVEETRDRYFLRISKMQSHVVDKADLTQGSIEELNEILASNLGLRFKRMK